MKDDYVVEFANGKLQIVDKGQERLQLPPVNLDKRVYPIIIQFDGSLTVEQIMTNTRKLIGRDATSIIEKLCVILLDRIEFHSNNLKTRIIYNADTVALLKDYKPEKEELDTLKQINFSIEPTCGFSCIYCFANAKHTTEDSSCLSLEEWDRITKEAKQLGCQVVFYGGGDPIRKKNLEDYMEISSKNGLAARLSTRSYIPDERMKRFTELGLNMLQLSIDSYDRKMVDLLSGQKGTYDGVMETAKCANKYGLEMHARSVLTRYNAEHYEKWVDLMVNMGFKKIMSGIVFASCGKDVSNLYPDETQIRKLEEMVYRVQNRYQSKDYEIYFDNNYTQLFNKPLLYLTAHRHKCKGSTTIMNVAHDGNVYYCDTLIGQKSAIIGDLKKQTLTAILNSDLLKKLRFPNIADYTGTECAECRMFSKCAERRCYMRSLMAYGSVFEKDPWCPKGEPLPFYCPM